MAYFVKPMHGEPRRMERAALEEALQKGEIPDDWLIQHERENFWCLAAMLSGKMPRDAVSLFCPRCPTRFYAPPSEIGRQVKCPVCKNSVTVVDPRAFGANEQKLKELLAARQTAFLGLFACIVGTGVTIGSFFLLSEGGVFLWWGPMIFGLAGFVSAFPRYWRLRRKLAPLVAQIDAVPPRKARDRSDPRDRY